MMKFNKNEYRAGHLRRTFDNIWSSQKLREKARRIGEKYDVRWTQVVEMMAKYIMGEPVPTYYENEENALVAIEGLFNESYSRRGRMLKESEDECYTFTYEKPSGDLDVFTIKKRDLLDGSRWSEVEYREYKEGGEDPSYDETVTGFDVPTPPIYSWNKIELICAWRNERGESDIWLNGPHLTFDEIVSIEDPDGNEVYNRDSNRSGEFYRAIGQLKRLNDAAPEDKRAITVESRSRRGRMLREDTEDFPHDADGNEVKVGDFVWYSDPDSDMEYTCVVTNIRSSIRPKGARGYENVYTFTLKDAYEGREFGGEVKADSFDIFLKV